jgi:M6 family metalloprotease-like protein
MMNKPMKHMHVPVILAICICLTTLPRAAQSEEERPAAHAVPLSQQFTRKHGAGWTVRLSADKKRIASAVGLGSRSYGEQPEAAARAFLTEDAKLFGLRPDLADLRVISQRSSGAGGHVEFQQVVNGLPVENSRVQVNLSKDGRILQVVNNYAPFAPTGPANPALSKQQAIDAAIAEFLRTTPATPPDLRNKGKVTFSPLPRSELELEEQPGIEDVNFAVDGHPQRAYKVMVAAKRPFGRKEFIVDGATGKILRTKNGVISLDVTGTGQVFNPNPVASLNDNTVRDTTVANTNPNPYYTVELLNLNDPTAGPFVLNGPFANMQDIASPSNTPISVTGTAAFTFQSNSDNFGDTNVYHAIDRSQRYIQQLGFVNVNNRAISADSRGEAGCNAHYHNSPAGAGYLTFGTCPQRVAEDAEAVVHEYGHSIQDNTATGKYIGSDSGKAMGEGFADYWAMSDYMPELIASGHDQACFADWAVTEGSCLRRLDTGFTMDDFTAGGDEHANGQIWSQALFNLLNSIGKTTTDRVVLQSHFNVPDAPTFKQAADAMLTADLQIFFGAHIAQLCQEFSNRKIYGAGDCPVLPPNTGAQSTLIVGASFNETGLPGLGVGQINPITTSMNAYLTEVSMGQASLGTPSVRFVPLANDRAHYYDETSHNMLVDMVQEVINLIHATEPGFDFAAVDRLFIVTNDDGSGGVTGGQKEWATTGPWPYAIPSGAGTKRFSASIHTFSQTHGQFDHALGHHFGMFDLYAYDGVTFPRPYADGWSNMAKAPDGSFNDVHFFAWDKVKPSWLSGANITFIPRPPADPAANHRFEQTFSIYREETASGDPVILQIGTTPGVTQRINERASYYVEARKKSGSFDSALPSNAVLVYYVNEDIGQGFGPLRLIDAVPGTSNDLTDAGLLPSPATSTLTDIDSSGLNVEVLTKVGSEDYRVHITYDPPETQNDVWIHPHDGNWKSPDIWIDSPACNSGICGFDTDGGRTEVDRGDKPQPNKVNRIYARIFNHGPATAHNVQVDFYVSEPWHAIDGGDVDPDTGGNTAFNHHFVKFVADVPPTDDINGMVVYVEWTPTTPSGDVHTCIKVKIATVFNDINPANQASQENIDEYDLTSHSPYPPVQDDFKVVNPYDHGILVYLRADDVPAGWTADIVPKKAYIPVGGSVNASMTIQAPLSYPICSTEFIKATAWYPAGDTLVPLGASVAQVNLKKSTDLTTNTTYQNCKQLPRSVIESGTAADGDNCQELVTRGCTIPKRPFEHITLTYTGPDGKPIYHDVVTDKDGCYEDFLVNPLGGPWHVDTQYQGSVCTARTDGPPQTVAVPPGGSTGPGEVPPGVRARLWYSFHLGMNFPTGSFKENFDPGPSMTADLEYQINNKYSIEAMVGTHFFDERNANAVSGLPAGANLIYRNMSLNLRAYAPFSWAQLYVQAGPGKYFPNYGSTVSGANIGVGLSFPILTNFKVELGTDLHIVDPGGLQRRFVDNRLGVSFRF